MGKDRTGKRKRTAWMLCLMVAGVLCAPAVCYGEAAPVYGTEIQEGTYEVEVKSSSSMFRIVKAQLTVDDGKMNAVVTLGGKGYLKLFMGTGEDAEKAEESSYIPFVEDAEGAYTYDLPIEALNTELECTGFSKRKQKWYDHQIVVNLDTLPEEALLTDNARRARLGEEEKESLGDGEGWKEAELDLAEGNYRITVRLSGGTGRAEILSPALLTVSGKKGTVFVEWSSQNYDYMLMNGQKYLPVNQEGNSCFALPLLCLNQEIPVIADTTAMGRPHEIEYRLLFDGDSIQAEPEGPETGAKVPMEAVAAVCLVIGIAGVLGGRWMYLKRRGR